MPHEWKTRKEARSCKGPVEAEECQATTLHLSPVSQLRPVDRCGGAPKKQLVKGACTTAATQGLTKRGVHTARLHESKHSQ